MSDYRLEGTLGQGGMATVFDAVHVETGVHYALKILSAGADANSVERFRREAQAQARVDRHPNVVRIHTSGFDAGRQFLVMDLATGGDLQFRLREGAPDPTQVGKWVADLARGLAHVHAQGILHRDLKPANVMFDEFGTPKLGDFGVARVAGEDSLTQTGSVLGSPAFRAPEDAESMGNVDVRTARPIADEAWRERSWATPRERPATTSRACA